MSTGLRVILISTGILVLWIVLALILKYGFGVDSRDALAASGCITPVAFMIGGLISIMCEELS